MIKKLLLPIFLFNVVVAFSQQKAILLYPNGVPNSKPAPADYVETTINDRGMMVTNPTLTPYFPSKVMAKRTAVIICPGGGYQHLAFSHEGYDVARKFNTIGVVAFVLKYRLPSDKIMVDKTIAPLQDLQRAIQIVRESAAEWNIDTSKVGVIGFSAGGHLASLAGTHFSNVKIDNKKNINLRPDFMMLLYPRITFSDKPLKSSGENLLGKDAPQALIDLYSTEKQVTSKTPPTFIVHAGDDKTASVKNSLMFYEALIQNNVKAEMHVYQAGGHGFGLNNKSTADQWFDRAVNFLRQNGF
ncbi:alpha/beta hydrolase [Pedobacter sp. P351]|uniref:alpha/beta hydrolase n=1 Tax=Pedobacter superstes TaxID=3133441 RepID=UPI0030966690